MTSYQARLVQRFERFLREDAAIPTDLTAALLNEGLDPSRIEATLDTNQLTLTEAL